MDLCHCARKMREELLSIILLTLLSPSISTDTITPAQPLREGQTLVSSGSGKFSLGFFSPSKSKTQYVGIWYNKISVQTVVWVANRVHPVTAASTAVSLTVTGNGRLVIVDNKSSVIWSSEVAAAAGVINPVAQLLDNGNFVIREANTTQNDDIDDERSFAWQSFDYPTDTLLPGMKKGWDLRRRLLRNLTSWQSPTDPSPGDYCNVIDIRGRPEVLILRNGQDLVWRAGPWNGLELAGIPGMKAYPDFNFDFVINEDEVYYTYTVSNSSVLSRLVVTPEGYMQQFVWLEHSNKWGLFLSAPQDPCDLSPCGPYGVCDTDESPICDCLQGFVPKSPVDWAWRDGSAGCVRKSALDCANGTDGFAILKGAKLPRTASTRVEKGLGLDECRDLCLKSCSCTAYASADVRNMSGCIVWMAELVDLRVFAHGGQDLYVRLAAADLGGSTGSESHGNQAGHSSLVLVLVLESIIFGTVLIVCFVYRVPKLEKRVSNHINSDERGSREVLLELPQFDLEEVSASTNNFSEENLLGEGGFGHVYKGIIGDGQEIAVKRLSRTSKQGLHEFMTEISLIGKLQHRNLVRLLGCCLEREERILIYEFMPNKSLDTILFDKEKRINWRTRYCIILGIARGLLYLHQDSILQIIHRDLKASNILLDHEMNPKISDFGIARIFGGDQIQTKTRRVVGTIGYMSPEYVMDGIFSVKSDVFSFGVIILEIISGRKNKGAYLSQPHQYLLGQAWNMWNEGKAIKLLDPSIDHSFPITEVLKCIKIGLLCVQECPEDRPTMVSIITMLTSDNVPLLEPKQPGFSERLTFYPAHQQEVYETNSLTFTMFSGR